MISKLNLLNKKTLHLSINTDLMQYSSIYIINLTNYAFTNRLLIKNQMNLTITHVEN